jgi:hypothetical protein
VAPACNGAAGDPASPDALPSFDFDDSPDESTYTCDADAGAGAASCEAPELRLAIQQITVADLGIGLFSSGLALYCLVTANDADHSEVIVTPLETDVEANVPAALDPSVSLVWGQTAMVRTGTDLSITYTCYRSESPSTYDGIVASIGAAAPSQGGAQGAWGWTFGLADTAAGIVQTALAANPGDDLRLSVEQIIDASALLDLTNGRYWTVRQTGDSEDLTGGPWDMTVEVESWGCADARPILR